MHGLAVQGDVEAFGLAVLVDAEPHEGAHDLEDNEGGDATVNNGTGDALDLDQYLKLRTAPPLALRCV